MEESGEMRPEGSCRWTRTSATFGLMVGHHVDRKAVSPEAVTY